MRGEEHTCAGKSISGESSSAGAVEYTFKVGTVSVLVAVIDVQCTLINICNLTKFINKPTFSLLPLNGKKFTPLLTRRFIAKTKCVKVCALFEENKVR